MSFVNTLLPALEHFRILGYWIVLALALLESLAFVGVVVPGARQGCGRPISGRRTAVRSTSERRFSTPD